MSNWLRVLSLAVCAVIAEVAAAADVDVRGRIVDAGGRTGFEGAIVTIEPLGLETISARDGTFRIAAVPAGNYVLRVDYVGAPTLQRDVSVQAQSVDLGDIAIDASVTELGDVLVIGQLASLASAANRKRAADTIVDSVSADAIGQLPDQNAAEALQRLPGVSVITEQGEGRFVSVRGIDPNLNSVSVGGVRLPSGEDDARQIELDLIPTELLQTLAVEKTQTPDEDADAIGASIEVDTVTAFDRADASASATMQGSHDETSGSWSPKAWGSATRVFDVGDGTRNFGVALAATWTRRKFGWATLENEDGWPVLNGPEGAFRSASSIEQHNQRNDLERSGFALNLDYRPGDDSEWYLHTLHTNIDDAQTRELNRFRFDEGDVVALEQDRGAFTDARLEKSVMVRREVRQLTSITAGHSHHIGPWTLDVDGALARTREREPDSMEAIFHADTDLAYAGTGPIPILTPTSAAGSNPSAFVLDQILNERDDSRDREEHLRFDARRDLSVDGQSAFLKFGAKARRREKTNDVDITTFDGFGREVLLSEFATTNDYPFGDFGPVIAANPMRRFFDSGRGSFDVDEAQTFIDSRSRDYHIDEDVDAAYAMGGIDVGTLRVVGGVRVERTDLHAEGTRITVDANADGVPALAPVVDDKHYTDVLPGVHLRYELSPTWLARIAVTQSLARPSFGFLAPAQRIDVLQGGTHVVRRAEIGNPELDPYRSSNFDVSIEYYGDRSLDTFSAGAFFKRIDNPIVLADLGGTGIYADFDSAIVPVNGDSARLTGLELSFTHRYASLPAPWDGLLTATNLTLTDSDARLRLTNRHLPLPNQSDHLANLVVGYESDSFDLRVAGNYRSPRLVRLDDPQDSNFDVYEGSHFSLDVSAKLRLNDHWRVQFDAINLTDRPLYEFYGDKQHLARFEDYGRTLQIGLRCDL